MLTPYLAQWLLLVGVFAAACVSPGPDFVMAVKNSLSHGRRAGVFTAIGFGVGVAVHVAYTLAGIGALIAQSIVLFNIVKYAGAAYLVWLGLQALRSRGMEAARMEASLAGGNSGKSDWSAFRDGFVTNVLNPKATLFFVALFSQLVGPAMPFAIKALFGLTCCIMVSLWFTAVALMMTQGPVRRGYVRASKWIDRTLGVFLLAFGLRLAFSGAPR